jgi:hypothetical protein
VDLEAVEMLVRGSMHRAGAEILGRLLSQGSGESGETPCACGHTAHYHDMRPKQLLTALGPVRFQRSYYVCPHCHQGQSPRDGELDVAGMACSPGVRRMLAVVGSESSFEQSREQLELLAGIEVTAKAVERHAEAIGSDIEACRHPRWAAPSNWNYPWSAAPQCPSYISRWMVLVYP